MSLLAPRGMTLTELLVAMATLTGMIAGTGFVFTESSRAVAAAQVTISVNANLRATAALLREDIRSLCPDGVLIVSGPSSASAAGQPQVLMFTATGRFVSATETDPATGGPVTSNAAMIVYVLAEDAAAGGGGGGVLCRYVYLLSGDRSRPANLRELTQQARAAHPDDPNPFDGSDVLGDSLGAVLGKAPGMATGDNGPLDEDYLDPLLSPPARVNTAPLRMDDAAVGGVAQLWPYVAGGCDEIAFTFADGYAEDGVTPSAATEWFTTASVAAHRRLGGDRKPLRRWRNGSAWIVWRRADRDHRPDAIRVQLTLGGPTGETSARAFEIILPIRP